MEDVLSVYKRPYDPLRPVVCLDETSRQLIEKTHLPPKPGQLERIDFEYRRHGVANIFMAFEPLAAKRVTKVTTNRKRVDFAHFIKELVDIHYAHTETVVLVMDNLNIHSIASLYEAFPPAQARRIAERLEIHYTPIHASWLNMVEIEIGVLARQCLPQSFTNLEDIATQVMAWNARRNAACHTVQWRFTAEDARIKLKRLYPLLSEN